MSYAYGGIHFGSYQCNVAVFEVVQNPVLDSTIIGIKNKRSQQFMRSAIAIPKIQFSSITNSSSSQKSVNSLSERVGISVFDAIGDPNYEICSDWKRLILARLGFHDNFLNKHDSLQEKEHNKSKHLVDSSFRLLSRELLEVAMTYNNHADTKFGFTCPTEYACETSRNYVWDALLSTQVKNAKHHGLIPEAVAGILGHFQKRSSLGNEFLVIKFGFSGLNISIVQRRSEKYEIKFTQQVNMISGRDLDNILYHEIFECAMRKLTEERCMEMLRKYLKKPQGSKLKRRHISTVLVDAKVSNSLRMEAIACKESLSTTFRYEVNLPMDMILSKLKTLLDEEYRKTEGHNNTDLTEFCSDYSDASDTDDSDDDEDNDVFFGFKLDLSISRAKMCKLFSLFIIDLQRLVSELLDNLSIKKDKSYQVLVLGGNVHLHCIKEALASTLSAYGEVEFADLMAVSQGAVLYAFTGAKFEYNPPDYIQAKKLIDQTTFSFVFSNQVRADLRLESSGVCTIRRSIYLHEDLPYHVIPVHFEFKGNVIASFLVHLPTALGFQESEVLDIELINIPNLFVFVTLRSGSNVKYHFKFTLGNMTRSRSLAARGTSSSSNSLKDSPNIRKNASPRPPAPKIVPSEPDSPVINNSNGTIRYGPYVPPIRVPEEPKPLKFENSTESGDRNSDQGVPNEEGTPESNDVEPSQLSFKERLKVFENKS